MSYFTQTNIVKFGSIIFTVINMSDSTTKYQDNKIMTDVAKLYTSIIYM